MVAALEQIRDSDAFDIYFANRQTERIRKMLESLPPNAPRSRRLELMFALGRSELMRGNEDESLSLLTSVYNILTTQTKFAPEALRRQVAFELGVAFLRKAETENCCTMRNMDSCIFPIHGGGVHSQVRGSEGAIAALSEVLRDAEPDEVLTKRARWLLNIAYMTLGRYPDGVPSEYLIPERLFQPKGEFPRFRNVASELRIDSFSLAGGAAAEDFDNDGYYDIVVSSMDPREAMRMLHQDPQKGFVDVTEKAGLSKMLGGLNIVTTDYNNDGYIDLFVLRGAWGDESGRHPNSLLRNNRDGTFTDVAYEAGLAEPRYPTQAAVWADFDNDGWLDVYIGNEQSAEVSAPAQLFHNRGDGTFVDIAEKAGVTNGFYAKAVAAGDYDEDGDIDLFVSNYGARNRLYRNNGDGTFSDVAAEAGVDLPEVSFPAWFWDYNNDGHLDLFVSAYAARVEDILDSFLGNSVRSDLEMARLYRGDGQGHFVDVAQQSGLTMPTRPMGSNFGDLDNDGYLDFYLGTGDPSYWQLMPNVMYHNVAGNRFADVTILGGFGHLQKGHGTAFVDLDRDGDADVFEQMGGALQGDRYGDALYRNPGFGRHWISIKLVGETSNRAGIGARLQLELDADEQHREVYRHVSSGGSFGSSPFEQLIGLGKSRHVKRLEILWPSGTRQVFHDLPAGAAYIVVESDSQARRVEIPAAHW